MIGRPFSLFPRGAAFNTDALFLRAGPPRVSGPSKNRRQPLESIFFPTAPQKPLPTPMICVRLGSVLARRPLLSIL